MHQGDRNFLMKKWLPVGPNQANLWTKCSSGMIWNNQNTSGDIGLGWFGWLPNRLKKHVLVSKIIENFKMWKISKIFRGSKFPKIWKKWREIPLRASDFFQKPIKKQLFCHPLKILKLIQVDLGVYCVSKIIPDAHPLCCKDKGFN